MLDFSTLEKLAGNALYSELVLRAAEYLRYTNLAGQLTDPDAAEKARLATELWTIAVDNFLSACGLPEPEISAICDRHRQELAERITIVNAFHAPAHTPGTDGEL